MVKFVVKFVVRQFEKACIYGIFLRFSQKDLICENTGIRLCPAVGISFAAVYCS